MRLGDFLQRELGDVHRLAVRQLLGDGAVAVNGATCTSDRRLRTGDVVSVLRQPDRRPVQAEHPVAAQDLRVLLETDSALVIAKPPALPTVPDRSGRDGGVHALLPALRPGADLRIVHRLDRDTSGCLLLAKGLAAARHFDAAFRAHEVHKTYVALVQGVPTADEFPIDAWLGPDKRRPGKVVASADERPGFRSAHTKVVVQQRFERHALLALHPTTGRGHQLRVHLQSVGHPIVADLDYGGERPLLSQWKRGYKQRPGTVERPLLERLFLHAQRLVGRDLDGRELDAEAPLPDDLTIVLRHLTKRAPRRSSPCD